MFFRHRLCFYYFLGGVQTVRFVNITRTICITSTYVCPDFSEEIPHASLVEACSLIEVVVVSTAHSLVMEILHEWLLVDGR